MTPMPHLDLIEQPWAVRPELLPLISAHLRGDAGVDLEGAVAGAAPEEEESPETTPEAARGVTASGGIAILSLRGMIMPRGSLLQMLFGGGGGGLQAFRAGLRQAVASPDIGAIVIEIDSPGGSISLVTETAADIREARKEKTVIAVANVHAASAAYWLAAQASELVVTPSGRVGSVGVFMVHEDLSKRAEDLGVGLTLISAGKYKTEGHRFVPLSEEAREHFQEVADEGYAAFVADLAKGRDVSTTAVKRDFGEGRMVSAKAAVSAGMADRVDTLENVIGKLARGSRSRRRADDPAPAPEATEPEPTTSPEVHDPEKLAEIRERLDQTTESLKED